jgi:CRISPR/Cas system-associated exonuclease Cas4 (RecB family)
MFSQYMPVENLNIVYADMTDIVTYKVQKKDLSNWIKTRVQEIENSKESQDIPKGETSGLCKFCKYQTQCLEDGCGLTEKPLSIPKPKNENYQGGN